ncbi:MAG: hypothetical protein E7264_07385 [Lachnospiraceae bacterium]|nr:hypothetical protein [Lachnospiraceae bacterium]
MNLHKNIMRKETMAIMALLLMNVFLVGCDGLDSKSASLSVVYGVTTVVALLLLVVYCTLVHKKELWFLLLFSSVFIVNIGYFALSISKNLEEALLANRIAYLGSVFLPMSMLMIIINVCRIQYNRIVPGFLLLVSVIVFLVAASPGYLDIYYKEVSFRVNAGVGVLDKTYGDWHCLYLFYLIIYFGIMVITIIQASVLKKMESKLYAIMLAGAVLVNIGVWMLGQLLDVTFEFLSVSYIISEFFMLSLCLIRQEQDLCEESASVDVSHETEKEIAIQEQLSEMTSNQTQLDELQTAPDSVKLEDGNVVNDEQMKLFLEGVDNLTPTEKKIYHCYLDGKTTKEILEQLHITENTLKYHNKNIYSKLGVSSRKQLKEIARNL